MKHYPVKSALWLHLWHLKHNQLPRIKAWLNSHSQAVVMATCLLAGGFVIGQIASESVMVSRASDIHAVAYADGLKTGIAARKEELVREVKVNSCMNWLFNGDPVRVGRALKTGVMQ